ncbi:unnamed protein product [Dovyalis caffra]|uniref:Uncharacterized protein n=1 Tax=Dovyalis caffra TaxID=77055 RepID=A0AAV1R7W2_9ROSI|nr:unnamed protein product [Dovyalis caffra]
MENGGHERKLADKLSGLSLNHDSSQNDNNSLFQVMKAVEAAEATIKQQRLWGNWKEILESVELFFDGVELSLNS